MSVSPKHINKKILNEKKVRRELTTGPKPPQKSINL